MHIGDIPAAPLVVVPDRDLADFDTATVYLGNTRLETVIVEDEVHATLVPLATPGIYPITVILSSDDHRETLEAAPVVIESRDGWHTLASTRRDWADAPLDDSQLYQLLEVAKQQILAYAPALPETAAPAPSADIVGAYSGDAVEFSNVTSDAPQDYAWESPRGVYNIIEAPLPGLPGPVFAAVDTVAEGAGQSIEFLPPETVAVQTIPFQYRLGQLVQARDIWTATKPDQSTGIGPDGFLPPSPRPMSWHVKQLLRPKTAVPRLG